MNGENLRALLASNPNARHLEDDNNEYLVSYKFDTGAVVAFDPRTTTKCSLFVNKIPERMLKHLGQVKCYGPNKPSTALNRVAPELANSSELYKVDLPSVNIADELLRWFRWA